MDRYHALRSCNMFKVNPCRKKHAEPNACQKDRQIEQKHLCQFPTQPAHFLVLTDTDKIWAFTHEIQVFEGWFFFVILSNLVIASKWNQKSESVCAIINLFWKIDWFMASEGADMLIIAFTLKMGESVVHNTQNIFIWIFLSETGYI